MTVSTRNLGGGGTQGQLSLRDMSLSDDKILERGTQGKLSLRDIFLSDDKILKRGTHYPTVPKTMIFGRRGKHGPIYRF